MIINVSPCNPRIPKRCVKVVKDTEQKSEIHIEINEEDLPMMPSHIVFEHDVITNCLKIIIPAEWVDLITEKLAKSKE